MFEFFENFIGNASRPVRPSTARTETSGSGTGYRPGSGFSNFSSGTAAVPSLVDKLRRGVPAVVVEAVTLDDLSRSGSRLSGTSGGISFGSIPSSPHFQKYSTKRTRTETLKSGATALDAQPIKFSMKNEHDAEMCERFAEVQSKDELPRAIPKSNAEFNVIGQGSYAYDGQFLTPRNLYQKKSYSYLLIRAHISFPKMNVSSNTLEISSLWPKLLLSEGNCLSLPLTVKHKSRGCLHTGLHS